MASKNETQVLIISSLLILVIIGGGWWFFNQNESSTTNNPAQITNIFNKPNQSDRSESQKDNGNIESLVSAGNKLLIAEGNSDSEKNAVAALSRGNYEQAVSLLETSLNNNRNDPEALIYLNNARIGEDASYTLVASAPISSDLNVAQELLRGVAQAQNEINQNGGIAGTPLKIAIADEVNDSETIKQLADAFAKDESVLGVIGHYTSNTTLATAPIYQENGLVLISPTSTSVELSGASDYVFRTIPSDRYSGNALAKYLLQTLKQRKAAIIYTSESSYSQSLKNAFENDVLSGGGEIVAEFDFAQPIPSVPGIVDQVKQKGAQTLVMFPTSAFPNTVFNSLAIIQINNGNLSILGADSLYLPKTLEIAGESGKGLVLAIPWHILSYPDSSFLQNVTSLWGGDVSWRTALAYDATQALVAAISINPTRQGIREALSSNNFILSGASGNIKFLPSGDRDQAVQLVQIQSGNRSGFGVDFVPIP